MTTFTTFVAFGCGMQAIASETTIAIARENEKCFTVHLFCIGLFRS
jgi:predicted nucleotide-binding protein (sugar kinase/HSP70/actin superfamily)